jgi:hypothetical protein
MTMRDNRLLRFRRWPALWLAVVGIALPAARAADPAPGAADPLQSVLRLNAASQAFSYYGPWQKRNVVSLSGLATLVGDNLFLTPAALVQDRTQVELEKLRNGEKAPAEVIGVDYEANLALVRCRDAAFVAGLQPLAVSPKLPAGTAVTAWQFEDNGSPVATAGRFRRADVGAYPYGRFLSYEIEIALPVTETPAGTPAVADGQLVGLLLGYNSGTRALTVMAPEVIRHFLQDFGDNVADRLVISGNGGDLPFFFFGKNWLADSI